MTAKPPAPRPPSRERQPAQRIDLGEIARRAGVAPSTVSYALSGKRPISPAKRERILRLVEELGYRPNASARALAEGRTRLVGVVIPPPSHRLLDSQLAFIAALGEVASYEDLDLVLSPSSGDHDRSFRRLLSGSRVDGVLVMEVRMRDERIAALEQAGIPYVLIGRPANPEGLFWVDIDYGGLVERCVQHLADLGHRNVALLNRSAELLASGYGPAHRAADAFEAAVARQGLRGHPLCCPDDAAGGEECVRSILAARPRITAAITINESALSGVSRGLERARLRLPRDLSLIGIMGDRWAEDFHPRMTAAVTSPAELARGAFEMLLQRMADPHAAPRHLLQSPSITLGATTGQVPTPAGSRSPRG